MEESRAFYFTGAMALSAYHLHHRLSEDIDIFCPEENLIPIVSRKLVPAFERERIEVKVVRSFGSFWEAVLREGPDELRFQLAYDTPFHLAEFSEHDGVRVHSLDDLAAGKLLALFARAEERDFIDVYLLVQEKGYTIERLIELARAKDPGLDDYYLALAFEQAGHLPARSEGLHLTLLKDVDMNGLKAFFKQQAVTLLQRRLQR
jgi:predicted nucleotidyltransferase component of viral defense system